MQQYQDLVRQVLADGHFKGDRTGTGTRSIFGAQMRFDLSKGFPLCTTKKVPFRSVLSELLWFLMGSTNVNDLRAILHGEEFRNDWSKKTIWDDNAVNQGQALGYEDGELGPVYGAQWVHWKTQWTQPIPKLRDGLQKTYLNVANGKNKEHHPLKKVWEGMIARCYDKNSISYPLYGGRGVYVCDPWLEFEVFAQDVAWLKNYDKKEASGDSFEYQLDKDILGDGYEYSPARCMWATAKENVEATLRTVYTVEKDGEEYQFTNITDFCRLHSVEPKNFSDLWTGNKNAKTRGGFRLVGIEHLAPPQRVGEINQILQVIHEIKTNPNSRRLVVSAWNVMDLNRMALPPCHCLFQFYVHDGKLSCQLYQRSADLFLGVPFNIASYALLVHIIAQVCNLQAGEFIWTGGDVHLYENHVDQAYELLSREPRSLPTLVMKNRLQDFDQFTMDDFAVVGYDPHPTIKAPMAI